MDKSSTSATPADTDTLRAQRGEFERQQQPGDEASFRDGAASDDRASGNPALDREFVARSPGARNSGRNPWVLLSTLALCGAAMYFVITGDASKKASREEEKPAVFEVTKPRARVVPGKEDEPIPAPTAESEEFDPEPPSPTREELERQKELEEKRKQAEALKLARLKSAILVAGGHGSLASAVGSIADPGGPAAMLGDVSEQPSSTMPMHDDPVGSEPYSVSSAQTNANSTHAPSVDNLRPVTREDASSREPNERFFEEKSGRGAMKARATRLGNLAHTVLQGKVIDCILETAIQSDLPGQLRCATSNDVYAETGRSVMLPAKTRLIGQYNSAVRKGQVRVFVIWQRAITPDGVNIQLDSPGTDALGRAGIGGAVDNHYLEIFGVSAMLSIVGAGGASYGVGGLDQPNSESAYRQAIQQSFAQTAQQILSPYAQIAPTIHVNQGEAIKVFVNRDLDFSRVYAAHTVRQQPGVTLIQ